MNSMSETVSFTSMRDNGVSSGIVNKTCQQKKFEEVSSSGTTPILSEPTQNSVDSRETTETVSKGQSSESNGTYLQSIGLSGILQKRSGSYEMFTNASNEAKTEKDFSKRKKLHIVWNILLFLLLLVSLCLASVSVTKFLNGSQSSRSTDFKQDFQQLQEIFSNWTTNGIKLIGSVSTSSDNAQEVEECPVGWLTYRQYCYLRVDFGRSFEGAQSFCESKDANLATIPTKQANEYIRQNLGIVPGYYWIGLRVENWTVLPWRWNDGQLVTETQTNWKTGSPKLYSGKCTEYMSPSGLWDDKECGESAHFICSKPKGDGCPDRWIAYQQYCYLRVDFGRSFAGAEAYCVSQGGNLATIPTANANEYIRNNLGIVPGYYWIGIKVEDWSVLPWHWNDGQLVSQNETNWAPGSPKIHGAKCTEYQSPSGLWDDKECQEQAHFICSKVNVPPPKKTSISYNGSRESYTSFITSLLIESKLPDLIIENRRLQDQINKNARALRCPSGVVVGKMCYRLPYKVGRRMFFSQSEELCIYRGGQLAEVPSAKVYSAVFDYVQKTWSYDLGSPSSSHIGIWLGMKYQNGIAVLRNGSASYTEWRSGMPAGTYIRMGMMVPIRSDQPLHGMWNFGYAHTAVPLCEFAIDE